MNQTKTKKFLVKHLKGVFTIFISPLSENQWVGSIVYHDVPVRFESKNQATTEFELKRKSLFNESENSVFQDCIAWIEQNLGKSFSFEEVPLLEQDFETCSLK